MNIELYGFFSEKAKQARIDENREMPISCMYLGEFGGEIEITAVFDVNNFKNVQDCKENNDYNWDDATYVGKVLKYIRPIYANE